MKNEIPEEGKLIKATLKTNKSKWLFGYYDNKQFVAFLDHASMIEENRTFYEWSDVEQWVYVKQTRLISFMFAAITSELMLILVSVGLSIELVKWISQILNGDNFTGIIIVKAVLLIICVSGIYSVLSRLNALLFKAIDKTN